MYLHREHLERITREYWEQNSGLDASLKFYICDSHRELNNKSLLEAELEYARQRREEPSLCQILVLPVGYSLEPLLQTVCVYQPQKLALLLNKEDYVVERGFKKESHAYAEHVVEAVENVQEKGLIQKLPDFLEESQGKTGFSIESKPDAVFKKLVELLKDETDIVIDVTGGKKSMVAGAYMYAAYAKARISYVDFEEYDIKHRRPYGFNCKIGGLTNPYKTFALREWERLKILYESYQFRAAEEILSKDICDAMENAIPASKEAMQKLKKFLTYHEKWERGDFRGAKQAAEELASNVGKFQQPSAVVELGDQWYEISGNKYINSPRHFYGNTRALQVYVYDELERIGRLIEYKQDYRSAFLRAGGVNEIVMLLIFCLFFL